MSVLSPSAKRLIRRDDLLDPASPHDLIVHQLTSRPDVPACHVYMEAQIFTSDSRYFLLQEGVGTHGTDHRHPLHRYLLGDVEGGELIPVTGETGATAPSISPDDRYFYYFVNESSPGKGKITLRRRQLDGTCPETLYVLDTRLRGTPFFASNPYTLSTISSDGTRLALSCFLGDGTHEGASYGLLVFDLLNGEEPHLILHGPSWCNMHPQYSRSLDRVASRYLMVQENHGAISRPDGKVTRLGGGHGADVHLLRDDGQHFLNLPAGRTEQERVTGHQCWRGRSDWAILSVAGGDPARLALKESEIDLLETRSVPFRDHRGNSEENTARRNHLTRHFTEPHFNHFATDLAGERLISDFRSSWDPERIMDDALYLMELGEPGTQAALEITYLLRPQSSWKPCAHVHPALSPDGRTALFNSDESGQVQAYLISQLPPKRHRI